MKRIKIYTGILLLGLTVVVFGAYLQAHPELLARLSQTPLHTIGQLYVLYLGFFCSLTLITYLTAKICHVRLPLKNSLLLTAYSSIINFFGPLQSGPGVRFIYLRKQHKISGRDFLAANLLYYALFAIISVLFLFGGSQPWWQTLCALLLVMGVSAIVIKRSHTAPKFQSASQLLLATMLQLICVAVIYFVELRSVTAHVSWHQALTYTGAANFALFVSLTPGAIGIRESFLLLSQRLHHLPASTVLTASLLDRAMYLLLLGSLLIISLMWHAQDFLKLRSAHQASDPSAPPHN